MDATELIELIARGEDSRTQFKAEILQRQRACMYEYIVGAAAHDDGLIEDAKQRTMEYQVIMNNYFNRYRYTIQNPQVLMLLDEAWDLYQTEFMESMHLICELAKNGAGADELLLIMRQYIPAANRIADNFNMSIGIKLESAAIMSCETASLVNHLSILIIAIISVTLITTVLIALRIFRSYEGK